jgi:hypothetical protein
MTSARDGRKTVEADTKEETDAKSMGDGKRNSLQIPISGMTYMNASQSYIK